MARSWSRRLSVAVLAVVLAACNQKPVPGIARGEDIFPTCTPCHGPQGHGKETLAAPNIAGLPQWYIQAQLEKFQAAHRGYDAWDTTGIRMKSMSWTIDLPGDLESLSEYVASLPRTASAPTLQGADAEAGKTNYQACAACHGANGEGNQAVNAPPLVGQADWYMVAQLHKFKAGWRGTDPSDIAGQTMRPNTLILDDQAMANVVAYIQTLR